MMTGRSTTYIAGAVEDEEVVDAAYEVEVIADMAAEDEDTNEQWQPSNMSHNRSMAQVKRQH